MGRRVRHFNPAHVDNIRGGTVLDARFLTGLANGAAVQTWGSRTSGGTTFTQATLARRPIYTTNQQGGQPAVVFTAASQHWMSRSGHLIGSTQNPYTIIIADNITPRYYGYSQTSNTSFLGCFNNQQWTLAVAANQTFAIVNTVPAEVNTVATDGNTSIQACGRSSSTTLFATRRTNGSAVTVTNANINLSTARNSTTPDDYASGPIYALSIALGAVSSAVERRIRHHYAFSFKLAQ